MKKIVFVTLASISLATYAAEISGYSAKKLTKALVAARSYEDCADNKCGTVAKKVNCTLQGNSIGKRRYTCSFQNFDEMGNYQIEVKGSVARNLFTALLNAGAPADSGGGSSIIEIDSIECSYEVGNLNYKCDIK